ncbi:MAG: NADPH:quinone oxidoreductase family protein [Pseudomonadota bacterium]
MRALLCKEHCLPEDLLVEEVPTPEPGEGQIRIKVAAAGVNFPDFLIIQNKYQFKPDLPFSPGGEMAGEVSAVGAGVTAFEIGQKVMGSNVHGGFAEEAIVDVDKAIPLPNDADLKMAAAIGLVYGTSYHALFDRGAMTGEDTVLVLGAAGGVGLAAVELAKAAGAKVIAAASTDEKLQICKDHGADQLLNYGDGEFRAKLKELCPDGPSLIYDPVGGELSELAFRSIGWRGRYLVIGFAAGDIPKIPLNLPLLKQASLVGVFWGAYTRREPESNLADLRQIMAWISDGTLKPLISGSYPLAEGGKAIRHIADRKALGKLIIEPHL